MFTHHPAEATVNYATEKQHDGDVGPSQLPATTHALIAGGGARVGFEDNIYFRKGELAKNNAQLVERTANFVHDLGLEVASPAEARDILGIPQLS